MDRLSQSVERYTYLTLIIRISASMERQRPKIERQLKEYTLDLFIERASIDLTRAKWSALFDVVRVLVWREYYKDPSQVCLI